MKPPACKVEPRRPNLYEAEFLSEFLFRNKTGKGAFPNENAGRCLTMASEIV